MRKLLLALLLTTASFGVVADSFPRATSMSADSQPKAVAVGHWKEMAKSLANLVPSVAVISIDSGWDQSQFGTLFREFLTESLNERGIQVMPNASFVLDYKTYVVRHRGTSKPNQFGALTGAAVGTVALTDNIDITRTEFVATAFVVDLWRNLRASRTRTEMVLSYQISGPNAQTKGSQIYYIEPADAGLFNSAFNVPLTDVRINP